MPFERIGPLKYYYFQSLRSVGLNHAVLTRHGGLSELPWNSLNLGGSVGDNPDHVVGNKKLILKELGFAIDSVFDVWQVHGNSVAFANSPREIGAKQQQADIILTDKPGITLLMRFADCVPILLFDPGRHVIGLVHAGWKGTIMKAVQTAVQSMVQVYGSKPDQILGAIGPSIGPDHYQVGSEVIMAVKNNFGKEADSLLRSRNGSIHFDLWQANRLLLNKLEVERVETAEICTACRVDDWFSHRAENGRTGRFGVVVGI